MASVTMLPTGARSHRILRETHWLGWITNPFLAAALGILQLFPGLTKDLFAGIIQPGMSAMLLGAVYRGGIVFWRVERGSRWSAVTVGLPAITTFTTLMGMATIVHWDRFLYGALAFTLWEPSIERSDRHSDSASFLRLIHHCCKIMHSMRVGQLEALWARERTELSRQFSTTSAARRNGMRFAHKPHLGGPGSSPGHRASPARALTHYAGFSKRPVRSRRRMR